MKRNWLTVLVRMQPDTVHRLTLVVENELAAAGRNEARAVEVKVVRPTYLTFLFCTSYALLKEQAKTNEKPIKSCSKISEL
jgi:hypothetical protein